MKLLLAMVLLITISSASASDQPNIDPNDMWNDYGGEWIEETQSYPKDSWVWTDDWNVYDEVNKGE